MHQDIAKRPRHQEEINLQSLSENADIQVGYFDNDIVIVDSVQKFAEISAAHVSMNAIVICSQGKVRGLMNGRQLELHGKQMAIIPSNVIVTDLMVSPDFDLKALFLTNRIMQSFLREKISVWNDMMYVYRQNIHTLTDDEHLFYTHFYDMLSLAIAQGQDNPYHTDIIQSLLRSAILGLCGAMKQMLSPLFPHLPPRGDEKGNFPSSGDEREVSLHHFQRFLNQLNASPVKHRTVESYAAELNLSSKYLSAICKKHSGKTANEWITEHVLEDISYYLKQTDFSIKQVCAYLGFPNPSFFGKYVKDHFGMTPMQYRNQ